MGWMVFSDELRAATAIHRSQRLGGVAPCRARRSGALRPAALLLAIALGQCLTGVAMAESLRFINYTTANGLGSSSVQSVYAVGSNVYAATAPTGSPLVGGGVSVSTNGGATFTNATTANGLATNFVSDVYAIGNTVYAASVNSGSDSGGLGISTNGGTSFINSGTASGLGSTNVQGIYAVGNTIYAATRPSGGGGGLSISTNGGASYTT